MSLPVEPVSFRHRGDAGLLLQRVASVIDPGAVLLVCATGGHLAQLYRIAPRLDVRSRQRLWVTFDSPQSRSLLRGDHAIFVPYTKPRDFSRVLSNAAFASRLLSSIRFGAVVSTGSAIAMSYLPVARAKGMRAVYIESAARSAGPSLTGRMVARVPGVLKCTQYRSWENSDWRFIGSVFDDYRRGEDHPSKEILKVVVTLGTIRGYGFERVIRRLLEVMPRNAEVLWQTGDTDTSEFGINSVASMPADELDRAMAAADVVVAHAGIGSALGALDLGRAPILVPRRTAHNEHVDDHQIQIAAELDSRGLALHREVEAISTKDLFEAAHRTVTRVVAPPIKIVA